jgi:hypothetical protein
MLSFVGLILTGEFTSPDELTEVSEVASLAVFHADGPELIRSEGTQSLEIQRKS